MKTIFILLTLLFFKAGAGEITLLEKIFPEPVELTTRYYLNAAEVKFRGLRFNADSTFEISAELENAPGVLSGMKLRQIYRHRKDALTTNLFWNVKGGAVNGRCRLHPEADPAQLMQLQLFFYNIRKNGSTKLKSLKLTVVNAGTAGAQLPELQPVTEKVFEPQLELGNPIPALDIPPGEEPVNADTLFTVEAKITGRGGSRLGLRLRQTLADNRHVYSNIVWDYPVKDGAGETLVRTVRIGKYDPPQLKNLTIMAVNCNRQGKVSLKSLRVFQEQKPRAPMP